jgi:hypothetical protein
MGGLGEEGGVIDLLGWCSAFWGMGGALVLAALWLGTVGVGGMVLAHSLGNRAWNWGVLGSRFGSGRQL